MQFPIFIYVYLFWLLCFSHFLNLAMIEQLRRHIVEENIFLEGLMFGFVWTLIGVHIKTFAKLVLEKNDFTFQLKFFSHTLYFLKDPLFFPCNFFVSILQNFNFLSKENKRLSCMFNEPRWFLKLPDQMSEVVKCLWIKKLHVQELIVAMLKM